MCMPSLTSAANRQFVTAGELTMGALALLSVSVLLYISDRGLDLADESFYLLLVKSPNDTIGWGSGFGQVLHPLYLALGKDWVLFRRAGTEFPCNYY